MDRGIPLTPTFYTWALSVPGVYITLFVLFRIMNLWPEKTRRGGRASDIMAFQVTGFLIVTYMSIFGVGIWFKLNNNWDITPLENNKYLGSAQCVEDHLLVPMLTYQFWQVVACIVFNDLRDVAMIGHHVVTCALAYVCLYPCMHYYSCFYFGVAELTNIPLTLIDTCKYFPKIRDQYPQVHYTAKVLFAGGFYSIRIIYWSWFTYNMLSALIPLLINGTAHSSIVVSFFLFAAAFLTGLQWLWGYKIFYIMMADGSKIKKKEE